MSGESALRVLGVVIGFVRVLPQFLHSKTASILVGILLSIIPTLAHAGRGRAAHEGDRLRDHVDPFGSFARNADFRF